MDSNVSKVSTYIGVREAMTQQQRAIGSRGQVVMVGRDIGTVVFPNAELKIYLDASAEERARRRSTEMTPSSLIRTIKPSTLSLMKRCDYLTAITKIGDNK